MNTAHSLASPPSPTWGIKETSAYRLLPDVDLTVVVTLYNYSQFITSCLDSILMSIQHDYSLAVEVIIVDDASTDSSGKTVCEWMRQHDDQRFLLVEKCFNTGLSDSRNLGIRLSRGECIFILDADNLVERECLSELHASLAHSSFSAAFSIITKFESDSGRILGHLSDRPFDVESLMRSNYIDAMAMFKKSALIDIGLYDAKMVHGWEDYDLWLSLGLAGHGVHFLPLPLSRYRVHGTSMLQRLNDRVVEVARYLFEKHVSHRDSAQLPDVIFGFPKSALLPC